MEDFDLLVHLDDHGVERLVAGARHGSSATMKAPTNEGALTRPVHAGLGRREMAATPMAKGALYCLE